MAQRGQDTQDDEGCLISLVKLAFGIAILVGGWWAIYWGSSYVPDLIDKIREDGPTWTETFTTTTGENQDDKGSSTSATHIPKTVPTNIDRMKNSDWLRSRHGGTYKTIKNLPWVKDGLTEQEAKTAQNLIHMGANDHETLGRALELQWTGDSITSPEAKAIQQLMYLSSRDKEVSRKLIEMPFLESVTEADALLIDGLHGRWHRGTLSGFMNHSAMADGITDNETGLCGRSHHHRRQLPVGKGTQPRQRHGGDDPDRQLQNPQSEHQHRPSRHQEGDRLQQDRRRGRQIRRRGNGPSPPNESRHRSSGRHWGNRRLRRGSTTDRPSPTSGRERTEPTGTGQHSERGWSMR